MVVLADTIDCRTIGLSHYCPNLGSYNSNMRSMKFVVNTENGRVDQRGQLLLVINTSTHRSKARSSDGACRVLRAADIQL